MKKKCDVEGCDKEACVREVVIRNGKAAERHLCQAHAKQQGLVPSPPHAPISELLTKFVISAGSKQQQQQQATHCVQCGLTYIDFRKRGLLGCPDCYAAFLDQVAPLMERAHEGATHHVGKVPRRAGRSTDRQQRISWLRRQLQEAVDLEQYERAAGLRDDLRAYEKDAEAPDAPAESPSPERESEGA